MRLKKILFVLLMGAVAVAHGQDTLNVERKFKEGDIDEYTLKMAMTSAMGDIAINASMKQTVKKVYSNGDADIESAVSEMQVNVGGNEVHPDPQPPTTMKLNKFGQPLANSNKGTGFSPSQLGSYWGDKPLKAGETFAFDEADKANPKVHRKGSVKVVSIADGKAQLDIHVDVTTPASEKPIHMDGNALVSSSTGKLLKMQGNLKDLPIGGQGGMSVSTATITIEHK